MKNTGFLYIGMEFDSVVSILGQPISTNKGTEIIGGEGQKIGLNNALRSKLFHTEYCLWNKPEGSYQLIFEFGRISNIYSAPEGSIRKPEKEDKLKPEIAKVIMVLFANTPFDINDLTKQLLFNLKIEFVEDPIIEMRVNPRIANDTADEGRFAYLISFVLTLLEKRGISDKDVTLEDSKILPFRIQEGYQEWTTGIIYIVPPSKKIFGLNNICQMGISPTDNCAKCGRSREAITRYFDSARRKGVKVIGNGDVLLYCDNCKLSFCGKCQIDLGMSSGCPLCRKALD